MAPPPKKHNEKKGKRIAKRRHSKTRSNTRSQALQPPPAGEFARIPRTPRGAGLHNQQNIAFFRNRKISVGSVPKSLIKQPLLRNQYESDTSSSTRVPKKKRKKSNKKDEKEPKTPSKNDAAPAPEEGKLLRSGRTLVPYILSKREKKEPCIKKTDLKVPMSKTERRSRGMKYDSNTDFDKINFKCDKGRCKFKICSWDVNGLRAAIKHNAVEYILKEDADIVCLQNIRCRDIPPEINALPQYKKYMFIEERETGHLAGLLVLSKEQSLNTKGWIQSLHSGIEARVMILEFTDFYVICALAPHWNTGQVKGAQRKKWDKAFRKYVHMKEREKPVIVCANMNMVHSELDSSRLNNKTSKGPSQNQLKRMHFYKAKLIENMTKLLGGILIDSFRHLYPSTRKYSFFSPAWNCRKHNVGWRLSYIIVSKTMEDLLCCQEIRNEVKSSSHSPIVLCFLKQSFSRPRRTDMVDSDNSSSEEESEDEEQTSYPLRVICLEETPESIVSEMADQLDNINIPIDTEQDIDVETETNDPNLGTGFLQRRTYGNVTDEIKIEEDTVEDSVDLINLQLDLIKVDKEEEASTSTGALQIDMDYESDNTITSGDFPTSEPISDMDQSPRMSPNVIDVMHESLPPEIADMLQSVMSPTPPDE